MANVDGPHGFRALGHAGGTPGRLNSYAIAAAYSTDIFYGDLVNLVTAGTIELSVAATAFNIGVFQGVQYVNSAGDQIFSKYWDSPSSATSDETRSTLEWVSSWPMLVWRRGGTKVSGWSF